MPITSATLDGVCARRYADDPTVDGRVWEAMHVAHALARSAEFDLVHNHLDWLPLAFANHCRAPVQHGAAAPDRLRGAVQQRFGADRMMTDYLRVYRDIVR